VALSIFVWVLIGMAWGISRFSSLPGSLIALLVSYLHGACRDRSKGIVRD